MGYKRQKKMPDREWIDISIHLKVDGKLARKQKKRYYARGRETSAHTLDDFARLIVMYEHIFDGGTTYAWDGLMQRMEKILPKRDKETADSVFEKYWLNINKTIDEDFHKLNAGDGSKGKYSLFPEQGDYLKYELSGAIASFSKRALPVKYGLLHYIFKYCENCSIDELQADLNNIPDRIKEIVDELISEHNKRQKSINEQAKKV